MNELVNMFLLVGDKRMAETHLKEPGFTYSVCEPFKKEQRKNEKIKKKKQEIQDIFMKTN